MMMLLMRWLMLVNMLTPQRVSKNKKMIYGTNINQKQEIGWSHNMGVQKFKPVYDGSGKIIGSLLHLLDSVRRLADSLSTVTRGVMASDDGVALAARHQPRSARSNGQTSVTRAGVQIDS